MPKVDFALEAEEDLEHYVNKNELIEEMKRENKKTGLRIQFLREQKIKAKEGIEFINV